MDPWRPNCTVHLTTYVDVVNTVGASWTEYYRIHKSSSVLLTTGRRISGWIGKGLRFVLPSPLCVGFVRSCWGATQSGLVLEIKTDTWFESRQSMGWHGAILLAPHFLGMFLFSLPRLVGCDSAHTRVWRLWLFVVLRCFIVGVVYCISSGL